MLATIVLAASMVMTQASASEPPVMAVAPFDADHAKRHQEAWAKHRFVPVEVTNAIGMKLVLIPPGEFLMGTSKQEKDEIERVFKQYPGAKTDWLKAEYPPHLVRITMPFYLGVCEVTQGEYERVMGRNPSTFSKDSKSPDAKLFADVSWLNTSRFPVENVSWDEVVEFCHRLSSFPEEQRLGRTYRLPTEAEWEFACRAGTTTPFHFGSDLDGRQANCDGTQPYGTSKTGPSLRRTCEVGGYQPSAFGLYDMHGNVGEWCHDWYGPYTEESVVDPVGASKDSLRVNRGGSWLIPAWGCRSAHRSRSAPTGQAGNLGFRVALAVLR